MCRNPLEFTVPLGNADSSLRTYRLVVIQQPQRARACGFGDKVSTLLSTGS